MSDEKIWTEEETEERRLEVWEMLCQNVPVTHMARRWGCSRQTIYNDIKHLRELHRDKIGALFDKREVQHEVIGDIIAQIDMVSQNAALEYAVAMLPGEKDKFLNTILKAQVNKARLMMELGALPKATSLHEIIIPTKVSFAQRFGSSDPMVAADDAPAARQILDTAERIIKLGAEEIFMELDDMNEPVDDGE